MATFKCKMCGAPLNVVEGQTVVTCSYCGLKQTVANANDERKENLFNRANALRLNNEFDKALLAYQSILNIFPNEPEAHWGIVLCKYGIEYIEDPKTKSKKPTIHRMSFDPILKDFDYLKALTYADVLAKEEYQSEAQKIANIQKNVLSISKKEKPFDIFICYKETDSDSKRTPDSVIAQQIYDGLIERGYKVFFSRITLESKLGTMYEPYIFAALNSAKIMICIGTKKEYFNAVWVKNEWSRFIQLMANNPQKVLIPCYKDINAYEMPEELLSFQALDLSKLGFMQDLMRGIDKIMGRDVKESRLETKIIQTNVNIDALLTRSEILISDGEHAKADELLEKVLNNDPKNSKAYLMKLLIELNLRTINDIKNLDRPINSNSNYKKALDFANPEEAEKISSLNEFIINKNEEARLNSIYVEAMKFKNQEKYDAAVSKFSLIPGYKAANKQASDCIKLSNQNKYNTAISYKSNGEYDFAIEIFESIADFSDSKKQIAECKELKNKELYEKAIKLKELGFYIKANLIFSQLENYSDSDFQAQECMKLQVDAQKEKVYATCIFDGEIIPSRDSNKLKKACKSLASISGYKDSDQLLVKYEGILKKYESQLAIQKEERKRARAIKVKKVKKIGLIFTFVALLLTAIFLFTFLYLVPEKRQNHIEELIDSGDFEEAYELINQYGFTGDSYSYKEMYYAGKAFEKKDYETGIDFIYQAGGSVDFTYDFNGGSQPDNNPIPNKTGYSFDRWILDNYSINAKLCNASIHLKALYNINQYNIFYECENGTPDFALPASYTIEQSVNIPNLSKIGYIFTGWIVGLGEQPPKKDYLISKGNFGNKILTANFTPNEYTIYLDANDGVCSQSEIAVSYDDEYILPTPLLVGFEFLGWQDANKNLYPSDNHIRYNLTKDLHLTAKWSVENYPIRYYLNGGSNNETNPSTYKITDETFNLKEPVRTGYTFVGWSTNEEPPTKNMEIRKGTVGSLTFYANWAPNSYKATFNVNEGNPLTYTKKNFIFDSEYILDEPTREGYQFDGWYYNNLLVSSGLWNIAEDCVLKAKWSIVQYNIIYNLDNGINNSSNPIKYNYEDQTITIGNPRKEGYTFLGWTNENILTPTQFPTIQHNSIGNVIFNANWSANSYNITYDVNGGEALENNIQEVIFDQHFTLIEPTKTGHIFNGWFNGNSQVKNGIWRTVNNITLIAKWTPSTYSITKENGTGVGTTIVSYGSNYNLGVSRKTGFEFTGYYSEPYGQGIQYTDANGKSLNPYIDTSDITLYASFIYSILFVSNGGTEAPIKIMKENERFNEDVIVEKENRTFGGWFTDIELTQPLALSDTGNTIGYAKWLEELTPTQLVYTINGEKITITGSSYEGGECILPNYIGGKLVTTISKDAFNNKKNITKLEIPSSVTTIEPEAFYGVTNLTDIILPFVGTTANSTNVYGLFGIIFGQYSGSSLSTKQRWVSESGSIYYYHALIPKTLKNVTITNCTTIPDNAFYGCWMIEKITLPENLTSVGEYVFYACSNLKHINSEIEGQINIPQGVTNIGKFLFWDCNNIVELNLSNQVTRIESSAFSYCENITKINSNNVGECMIPDSCEYIGAEAFYLVEKITKLVIPNSVTTIEPEAFYGVKRLTDITLPFAGTTANSTGVNGLFGIIFGYQSTSGAYIRQTYMSETGSINNFDAYIPKTLKNITITNCTTLSSGAFSGCWMIEKITLPENLTSIGSYAFYNCSNLFYLNSEIEGRFNIPNSITTIGSYAFYNCSSMTSFNSDVLFEMIIHDGVTFIDSFAFRDCKLIKKLTVPQSVLKIGEGAFYGMAGLTDIVLPFVGSTSYSIEQEGLFGYIFGVNTNSSVYTRQIYGSSAYLAYIPKTLKNVTITNGKLLSQGAFSGCSMIEKIILPNNLTTIGNHAFYNCSNLIYLNSEIEGQFNIPNKVIEIEDYAFYNCVCIVEVNLSPQSKKIGAYSFDGCNNIVTFNSNNIGECIIPNSCESIGIYAFRNLNKITKLNVPYSVTTIGEGAFYGLTSLTDIILPFVGNTANSTDQQGLFGYVFGPISTSGQYTTQSYGSGSYKAYIPKNLKNVSIINDTALSNGAFYGCVMLENISLLINCDTTATNCFYNCNANIEYNLIEPIAGPWNGVSVSSGFNSGIGTLEDPYIVATASELAYLAQEVNNGNSFENIHFKISDNINLNSNYLIIGINENCPFSGIIDGGGHVIRNLKNHVSNIYNGLFGYFNGQIKALGIENMDINIDSNEDNVYGGVFGFVTKNASICDVYVTGTIYVKGSSMVYVGGLIGYSNGVINNSYADVDVVSISTGYIAYAGGFVGYVEEGNINDSFTIGNVTAKGGTFAYSRNGAFLGDASLFESINNSYRLPNQILVRYTTTNSSYNEFVSNIPLTNLDGQLIVEYLNWNPILWTGERRLPTFE